MRAATALGYQHLADDAADDGAVCKAEHRFGGGVEFDDTALVIGRDERGRGMVHDGGLQRLAGVEFSHARSQLLFAQRQLGVVAAEDGHDLDPALDPAVGMKVSRM